MTRLKTICLSFEISCTAELMHLRGCYVGTAFSGCLGEYCLSVEVESLRWSVHLGGLVVLNRVLSVPMKHVLLHTGQHVEIHL